MSNTEFTPGPWEVWENHTQVFAGPARKNTPGHLSGARRQICELQENNNIRKEFDRSEMEANAQLIAAAPEMLAACEASVQCITDFLEVYKNGGSMLVMDEAVKSLRDDALRLSKIAVAKAEGGAL